ncbi:ChbG/HpnK family deacetylase [Paenibacillus sp. 32O-W]|uniref:ChbG/HpnK family deacetylase n=1 Tax=Paenibacillus sp. 32O-W TaxID=1695218 RepID=UPI0007818304|nr:ChbG/HpnK family deacetylase [Paenibacillus sp. 32O-W]
MMKGAIGLITRADDAGSSATANRAILEACDHGIIRNVSLMATCGAIEDAAELFRGRDDICFGVHLTLNAEWDRVRWGPVMPNDRVPTLIDAEGCFHRTPEAMKAAGALLDEAFLEMQAQLNRLRELGFPIRYADEHMFFGRVFEGYEERFDRWCTEAGLINFRRCLRRLPIRAEDNCEVTALLDALDRAETGIYTLVTHPAFDTPEMRESGHAGKSGEEIAFERERDTKLVTNAKVMEFCKERQIRFLRYDEVDDGRTNNVEGKMDLVRQPIGNDESGA